METNNNDNLLKKESKIEVIEILGKKINIKNYDCYKILNNNSNEIYKKNIKPFINLYIQSTPNCNAKCYFCNTRNPKKEFNFEKLEKILKELNCKFIIGKIAITGGEPLLELEKTKNIINIIKKHNNYITLNTNGYDLLKFKEIYNIVDEVNLSKHHYINDKNDEIMKIKTPDLKTFYENNVLEKVKINCVFQKNYIDSFQELINLLNFLGTFDIKELRSISLLPLTKKCKTNYVNLSKIMKECEIFLNDGYLYDSYGNKNFCKCFEHVYITNEGKFIKNTLRQTYCIEDIPDCTRQLVFDGQYLYDGFQKNTIII